MTSNGTILVVNCGSSSVKFAVFADDESPVRLRTGAIDRIGLADSRFRVRDGNGDTVIDENRAVSNHAQALRTLLDSLGRGLTGESITAVGHRVVHGGPDCDCPLPVDEILLARLRRLIPLAPLHLPHNIAGLAAVRDARPELPQIACFDTAFHRTLPRLARMTGLPRRFEDKGIRRYGFHGLSYEYVVDELRRRHGAKIDGERLVVAHLGNGASMVAIRDGRSVETTMGFSTLAGLPMGTRSGDLDPGILLHLLIEWPMSARQLQTLLYEQSGLLGLSGISRNMQELLARADAEPAAAEAVDFFCYRARKHLAALTAAFGGLDRVVFTGGIGANAPAIRAGICDGLGHLGIVLDRDRNATAGPRISADSSPVAVEAFPTDEELVIARHVRHLLQRKPAARRA